MKKKMKKKKEKKIEKKIEKTGCGRVGLGCGHHPSKSELAQSELKHHLTWYHLTDHQSSVLFHQYGISTQVEKKVEIFLSVRF